MLGAFYLGAGAEAALKQRQFGAAEPLTLGGRGADRAMVLDQQPAIAVAGAFGTGHVALLVAGQGEGRDTQVQALHPFQAAPVVRLGLSLAGCDQGIHGIWAEMLGGMMKS